MLFRSSTINFRPKSVFDTNRFIAIHVLQFFCVSLSVCAMVLFVFYLFVFFLFFFLFVFFVFFFFFSIIDLYSAYVFSVPQVLARDRVIFSSGFS